MRTQLVLVLIKLMLHWTDTQLGCQGMPIQDTDEDATSSSRLARSSHALHSRLCPEGSSSESCFYSQLSMFMRMQDSLMDPVALRNIGKRSSNTRKYAGSELHSTENTYDVDIGLNHAPNNKGENTEQTNYSKQLKNFVKMLDELRTVLSWKDLDAEYSNSRNIYFYPSDLASEGKGEGAQRKNILAVNEDFLPSLNTILENIGKENKNFLVNYLSLGNGQDDIEEKTLPSPMTKDILQAPSVQKRQIICPKGVSRLNCYDNALAYYLRMLKTLKNH